MRQTIKTLEKKGKGCHKTVRHDPLEGYKLPPGISARKKALLRKFLSLPSCPDFQVERQ